MIPTGIKQLDECLGGGFEPHTIALVGGKSLLARRNLIYGIVTSCGFASKHLTQEASGYDYGLAMTASGTGLHLDLLLDTNLGGDHPAGFDRAIELTRLCQRIRARNGVAKTATILASSFVPTSARFHADYVMTVEGVDRHHAKVLFDKNRHGNFKGEVLIPFWDLLMWD